MKSIYKIFHKKNDQDNQHYQNERGLLIYNSVNDVIQAESLLKKTAFADIKVIAPPPEYRTGCDLALEFSIIEQIGILHALKEHGLSPEDILLLNDETLKPTEISSTKDFGQHIMVRVANMKIVFQKSSLEIVNISGGGCSDVPYLAQSLIGKTLQDAPSPRDIGYTLCAYTLAKAFEESLRYIT